MHIPGLFIDLTIMLATAGLVTILFKAIKLPVILGYIVAGFLIVPYFPLFLDVGSQGSINVLSEIGVIIILFHIGLEFDLHKLKDVGSTALFATIFTMGAVMVSGFWLGKLLGLRQMDCIFLGAMLSISSTVVIQKCLEEQKLGHKKFAKLVMGMLILEDVVSVFMMVVLSTISLSKNVSGAEMTMNLLLMGCYLIVWIVAGIYIVPTTLNKIMENMTREMLTIVSLAFCFLMAVLANWLGFSTALGAFIAGSLFAGTVYSGKIEEATLGVKDLFGAVFFLSVGMLVDPSVISACWKEILPIAIFAVIAKLLFSMLGLMMAGQDIVTGIKGGLAMAPIGEFSFIIATLGTSLGVIDSQLYPIIVAASIITIILTPELIRRSDIIVKGICHIIPNELMSKINEYTSDDQDEEDRILDWRVLINSFLSKLFLYGIIMIMTVVVGIKGLEPMLSKTIDNGAAKLVSCVMIYIIIAIFLRPMMDFHSTAFTRLWLERRANRLPLTVMVMTKFVTVCIIAYVPLNEFYDITIFIPSLILLIALLAVLKLDFVQTFYLQLETRFLRNLNESILESEEDEFGPQRWLDEDFSIFSYFVEKDASYIGQSILELEWGKRLSVYIVKVRRGSKQYLMPDARFVIKGGDKLYIVGEQDNLKGFYRVLDLGELDNLRTLKDFMDADYPNPESALACFPIKVRGAERYCNKTIKQSGIKNKYHCMVLGIQRDGYPITMPGVNMVIKQNDMIWIMGSNNNIGRLASYSVGRAGVHDEEPEDENKRVIIRR